MNAEAMEVDGRRTDTHARILDVASRQFRERGYSATSLKEIAAEVGVTKAALYYHFDSKTAILRALVEPMFAAIEEVLTQGVDCSTARMRRAFVADLVAAFDTVGPVVTSIAIDPRAAADIRKAVPTTLIDRIFELLVDGLARETPADRASAAIRVAGALSAVQGMFDAWARGSDGATPMDARTRNLIVAVAAAALEAEAPA
jgi:AcrR family transcriptional regulator